MIYHRDSPVHMAGNDPWLVLDVAVMLEDLYAVLADYKDNNKPHFTAQEIFTTAWAYLLVDTKPEHIAEALMVAISSMCTMRLMSTIREIDREVQIFTHRLITYCNQMQLIDCRYGLLYEMGGWINDSTPFVIPIGTQHNLPPTSPLMRHKYKPVWHGHWIDATAKLPF